MEPVQEFSKVVLTLDNVLIPNERLRNTPSLKDGCPHELEVDLRIIGCEYIQKAGKCLRLPQVAMATAQILFQRFFYSKSLIRFNLMYVAMACIFLAAKIEENCRRVRDVANVFHRLKQQGMGRTLEPMDYMGEEYFKVKASVIKYERFLLKDLGFCVHVKHPHKLIIAYLQILEAEKNHKLAQMAWNYMNDSLKTNVFVRYTPETIACACIFLSARKNKVPLPKSPPWWLVFDVSYEDMEAISTEILALYTRPKLFWLELEKKLAVIKEEFCKKQVEVREVKLKKPVTDSSNPSLSPAEREAGSSTESPAPPSQSKLLSSPSLSQPTSQKNSPQNDVPSLSQPATANQIVANGGKAKAPVSPKQQSNATAATSPPAPKKRKMDSFSPDPSLSPVLETNTKSEERVKPIISPIRVAKASGSDTSSETGSSPRENGIPEQYRQDFTQHKRSKAHRHHHHHHHHHHRSSKPQHDRHHHHRERESRERARDREEDRRRREPSSKARRTEYERYR